MPIYEFDCHDCGKPFEALVFGFSTENVKCPECEGKNVEKKISNFASVGNSSPGSSSFSSSAAACSTGTT